MNKLVRTVLLIAAVASTSQAQYAPGDLILGFTKGNTDVMFDIGTPASLGVGTPGSVNLGSRISISLLLSSYGNDLSGVSVGMVGENSTGPAGSQKIIYSTVALGGVAPNTLPNGSAWNVVSLNVDSAGAAIDGHGTPVNSAVVDNSAGTGLSFAENITGASGNTFARNYGDPTTTTPTPFTSAFLGEDLYGATANNSTPQLLGTLLFGSNGSLTFNAVPEPTTWALLAGGLLAFTWQRRSVRKS